MMHSPIPIMLGYSMPEHAEMSSPIHPDPAKNIEIINKTWMPLVISDQASNCKIQTNGKVDLNQGKQIIINAGSQK